MSRYVYAPDGALEIYGVDAQRHCRKNNPLTAFGLEPLSDDVLAGFGYYPVIEVSPQYDPEAQAATDTAELQPDGTWLQVWSYRDLTPEEISARSPEAQAAAALQAWRNSCSVPTSDFRNAMTHFMVAGQRLDQRVDADVLIVPGVAGDRIRNSYRYSTAFRRAAQGVQDMVDFLPYLTDDRADAVFRVAEQYAAGVPPAGDYVVSLAV